MTGLDASLCNRLNAGKLKVMDGVGLEISVEFKKDDNTRNKDGQTNV